MRELTSSADIIGDDFLPPPSSALAAPNRNHSMFFFPPVPILDSFYDIASLSLIAGVLLVSLISVTFIFHLRLKSTRSHHLRNFNSLWTVRFLLVAFITLWALNDVVRLPFFRQRYLYPFLPSLTVHQQEFLCKTHVVLTLGFFEPGFLVTLLFLVNISTKKRNPHDAWAIAFVFFTCLPIFLLQTLLVYFSPLEVLLPEIFQRAFVLSRDQFDNRTVMCAYPLLNSMVFAAFGIAFTLVFLLSCWRVFSLVINKGIRVRIHLRSVAVTILVPMKIVLLGLSSLWKPEKAAYGAVMVGMCLAMSLCAVVGEVILIIRPISDALAAEGECCRWIADGSSRSEVDRERSVEEGQ